MLETLSYIAAIVAAIYAAKQYYSKKPDGSGFGALATQYHSDSSGSHGSTTIQGSTVAGNISIQNNFTGSGPVRHAVIDRLRQHVQLQDFVTDFAMKGLGLLSLLIAYVVGDTHGFGSGFWAFVITSFILMAIVLTPLRMILKWRLSHLIELQHLSPSEFEYFVNFLAERTWKDKTSLKDIRQVMFDRR